MGNQERQTLIYKTLSGAPMLWGLPIHVLLILVVGGFLSIFIFNLIFGWVGAVVAGVVVAAVWGMLGFIYGQDQTAVPFFFLSLKNVFKKKINSFAPSYQTVEIHTED